jgi:hypothetical protein
LGETWKAYRILVRKTLGNCPLGRPRRREGNIIKMALMEIGYEQKR